MTNTFVGDKFESLITKLLRLIDEGNQAEAIEAIIELSLLGQLGILEELAAQIGGKTNDWQFYLVSIRTIVRTRANIDSIARTMAHDPFRIIALIKIIAHDLALTLDLTSDHSITHNLARDLASIRMRPQRANELERVLPRARDRARDLANGLAHSKFTPLFNISMVLFFALDFKFIPSSIQKQVEKDYHILLANTLDEGLHLQQKNPSLIVDTIIEVLWHIAGNDIRHITLEGANAITPDVLANDIAPYFQALRDLQKILTEIDDKDYEEPQIVAIEQGSIIAEIKGFVEAVIEVIKFLKNYKQDSELRDLTLEEQRLSNRLQAAQNQNELARIRMQQSNISIEEQARYTKIVEETKQIILDTQLKLDKVRNSRQDRDREANIEYLKLADQMISERAPNLDPDEYIEKVMRVATALRHFSESDLQLRLGHRKPPPTLPEFNDKSNEDSGD